mgnify:FL=1
MALIKTVNNISPKISKSVYIADNATIIGDVLIGENSSVWFNTIIRGDVNSIVIGDNVNIQDGVVIHCTYKKSKVILGNNVSIGHNAIIHGCKIEDNVLIGMGAIIMDNAVVKKNSIVAAGSVVTKGTVVKSGTIFSGIPAKLKMKIDEKSTNEMTKKITENYILYSSWYS